MAACLTVLSPIGMQAAPAAVQVTPAAATVTGEVLDSTGEPLIGASVMVKGTTNGVATDIDGKFTLNVNKGATLVVSYVGYKTQEVTVNSDNLVITLADDTAMLEEVVVVGYGTQKRESLTGAVTAIDSKAFESKGALSSPLQALQGQVPGVMITRSSSAPGDESWGMKLRGAGSVNSIAPLIVIDGVASESVNDMRLLNSSDIESINFLKDGSAAIYGSRAAGGVVLITTKKGAEGKAKVDYTATATLRKPGLQHEMMDLHQWAAGVRTTLENDNNTSSPWYAYAALAQAYAGGYIDLSTSANPFGSSAFTDVKDFVFADDVNWLGSLFGDAWSTNHNLSISGGKDKYTYRISLGYMYDGSTLQYGKNNNQRYNFRVNNMYKFSDRVKLESVIAYNRQEQVAPTLVGAALSSTLPMPGLPLTSANGKNYAWGTWGSPVAKVRDGGDNKLTVSALNISETLNATILPWLDANVNLGYNTSAAWRDTYKNAVDYYNYAGDTKVLTDPAKSTAYSQSTSSRTDFYSLTGYLYGHHDFGKHSLSGTVGVQYEFKDYRKFGVNVLEPQPGLEIPNGSGSISINNIDGNKKPLAERWQVSNLSYFFRANYDYDGRYLLEVNGRYDGSSKFKSDNRWEFFYGVSGGWRISQEAFLRDISWLTNLKVRGSYAEMGNQSGISNYDGVQLYNLTSNKGAYIGGDLLSYIATNGVFASNSRSWERIKTFNVGLDFSLLNGSINGSLDYFEKHNDNMLVSITFPATLGDDAPKANVGKFKDWGYEGQVTYNGRIGSLNYNIGGTLTFTRNRLVDYGGTNVLKSGYTSTQQGYPLNSIFGMRYGGKIQNEEQLNAYIEKYYPKNGIGMPSTLRVGDNMFCDENGDGVLDEKDFIFLGSDIPEISYSFNAGINWKGLDVNVVFQGAANRFIYRNIDNTTVPFNGIYTNTSTASIGNTWSTDNPDAYYAPYTNQSDINKYNYQASSLTAQDGRYIRLKNVTVGYTFPSALMKKTHLLSNARIYVSGEDLWESTKLKDGWDPEAKRDASGTGRYPFTRNWTFGLNLTF